MRRAEAREATEAGARLESLRAGGQWRTFPLNQLQEPLTTSGVKSKVKT